MKDDRDPTVIGASLLEDWWTLDPERRKLTILEKANLLPTYHVPNYKDKPIKDRM